MVSGMSQVCLKYSCSREHSLLLSRENLNTKWDLLIGSLCCSAIQKKL